MALKSSSISFPDASVPFLILKVPSSFLTISGSLMLLDEPSRLMFMDLPERYSAVFMVLVRSVPLEMWKDLT